MPHYFKAESPISEPVGTAVAPGFLDEIEQAHRRAVGENFCYVAAPFQPHGPWQPATVRKLPVPTNGLWQLAIVRRGVQGYFAITEEFFLGSEEEAHREAERLNRERLHRGRDQATIIVLSSMIETRNGP